MDALHRISRLTCPDCGTLQESPGSTVCEVCGADLLRPRRPPAAPVDAHDAPPAAPAAPAADRTAALRRAGQGARRALRAVVAAPVRLVRAAAAAVFAVLTLIVRIVSVALRAALAVVLLAAVVNGLSAIPQVQAKVPAAKQIPGLTVGLLREGLDAGQRWLRALRGEPPPAATTGTRSAGARPSGTRAAAPRPSGATPAATAPAPRRPVSPAITVRSSPQGATVLVNQRRVGRTPITVAVAPGTYRVTISRAGYRSVTRTVTVTATKPASIDVTLSAAP